ncbi:MAG: DNA-directed RNA polymerase subunit B, partial [Candidatus Woesearchaeota archaeon]
MAEVYFDDKYYGEVEDPKTFVSSVRDARRNSLLPEGLTVHYNDENNSVDINACRGRVIRPLIVVKDGKPLFTDDYAKKLKKGDFVWDDLVEKGIIEYLDAAEEEDALVAFREGDLTEDHTHLEIAPLVIFGLGASTVPFIERNQAARLLRSVKTIKQAVGLYASNYLVRMDMDTHLLHQPQIPVVKTITHSLAGLDDHPAGQNMVVAVMDYDGYNMADAIVMNRGSVQRGIQRSSYFRSFEAEEARYPGGFVDKISPVDKDVKGYKSEHAYRYIEEDGIAYTGAKVEEGDVVI